MIFCIRPNNRYPIGFGRWRVIPLANIFLLIETPNGLIVIKYLSEISELGIDLLTLILRSLRDAQNLNISIQKIITGHQNAPFRLKPHVRDPGVSLFFRDKLRDAVVFIEV